MEAMLEENHLRRTGPWLGDIGKRTAILGRSASGSFAPTVPYGGAGFPANEGAKWL
jgi:hypothetical protein